MSGLARALQRGVRRSLGSNSTGQSIPRAGLLGLWRTQSGLVDEVGEVPLIQSAFVVPTMSSTAVEASASGTTFYIDPDIASSGDGLTPETAKKTWAEVTWTAGNVYRQKAGTTATLQLNIGASNVLLDRYGTGNDPILTYATNGQTVYISSKNLVTIKNFNIINTNATGSAILTAGTATDLVVKDCRLESVRSCFNSGMAITRMLFDNVELNNAGEHTVLYQYGVSTNVFVNNCRTITGGRGIFINNCANPVVTNCSVGQIRIDNSTGVMRLIDNVSTASSIAVSDNVVWMSSCTFSDGLVYNHLADGVPNGISFYNCTGPIVVRNCMVRECGTGYSTYGTGAHSSNIIFVDCIAEYNEIDGFITTNGSHDITFVGCIARHNGDKTTTAAGDGFSSHETDYNINFYNCISHDNVCSGWAQVGTSSGKIINCIAYNNGANWSIEGGGKLDQIRGGLYIAVTGDNATSGTSWEVKNYIGHNNYPVEVYLTASNKDIVDFDYNCYFEQVPGQFATLDSLATKIDWATYHASYEAHSIHENPLFTSPTDFRLQSTSPCINSGVSLFVNGDGDGDQYDLDGYMIWSDYFDSEVYHWRNGVDIGVYAYGGSTKVLNTPEILSGTAMADYVLKWPASPGLKEADDGTIYTGATRNEVDMATVVSTDWARFGSKGIAFYDHDLDAKTMARVDKILGV